MQVNLRLTKILYGLYTPTYGKIFIEGKEAVIDNPNKAIALGIGMVHQHFMLVPPFTVAENIILGMEPMKTFKQVDMDKAIADVKAISEKYGLYVDPKARVMDITVGMQQRVKH